MESWSGDNVGAMLEDRVVENEARIDRPADVIRCHVLDIRDIPHGADETLYEGFVMPRYLDTARSENPKRDSLLKMGVGILLARILGAHTDNALVIDPFGKPSLALGDVEIGISHAGNLAVLACSSISLGVDVEQIPDAVDRRHQLTLRRAYGDLLEMQQERVRSSLTPRRFSELWTKVEAAVKLDGRGLRADPRDNPQLFDGVHVRSIEYRGHVISVATRRLCHVEIAPLETF